MFLIKMFTIFPRAEQRMKYLINFFKTWFISDKKLFIQVSIFEVSALLAAPLLRPFVCQICGWDTVLTQPTPRINVTLKWNIPKNPAVYLLPPPPHPSAPSSFPPPPPWSSSLIGWQESTCSQRLMSCQLVCGRWFFNELWLIQQPNQIDHQVGNGLNWSDWKSAHDVGGDDDDVDGSGGDDDDDDDGGGDDDDTSVNSQLWNAVIIQSPLRDKRPTRSSLRRSPTQHRRGIIILIINK